MSSLLEIEKEIKNRKRNEKRKKLRELVFKMSDVFPHISLDTIMQIVLSTNGNEEKTIDLLLQNGEILNEKNNTDQVKIENVEFTTPLKNEIDFVSKKENEMNDEVIEVIELPKKEKEKPSEEKVLKLIKRLSQTFPNLEMYQLKDALIKNHYHLDDTAAFLLSQEFTNIEIEKNPEMEIMIDEISDDELTDDSTDSEEYIDDDDIEFDELIISASDQFDWYREAVQQESEYFKLKKEMKMNDYLIAKTLQEEEYNKLKDENIPKTEEQTEDERISYGDLFEPDAYWTKWKSLIRDQFPKYAEIIKIENIMSRELSARFKKRWSEKAGVPVLCFHGTSTSNVESIIRNGLLIPGKNNRIRIANGCAYGVGIYLARDPSISIHYCRNGPEFKMFVCTALIGKSLCTTHGDVIVLFDESLVLPCWLITFKFKHDINDVYTSYVPVVPKKKKLSKREKKMLRMDKKLKKQRKKKK